MYNGPLIVMNNDHGPGKSLLTLLIENTLALTQIYTHSQGDEVNQQ